MASKRASGTNAHDVPKRGVYALFCYANGASDVIPDSDHWSVWHVRQLLTALILDYRAQGWWLTVANLDCAKMTRDGVSFTMAIREV